MQPKANPNHWQQRLRAWWPLLAGAAVMGYFLLAYWFYPLPANAEGPCGQPAEALSRLQGSPSPRAGEWVTTEAVVTADFTADDQLRGFFFQQPLAEVADGGGSRALFVFAPGASVSPGERLRLRGRVSQFHGMTQLSDIRIESRCGQHGPVLPVPVSLPLSESRRQALQAMVIRLEPPLTVTGNYALGRYGALTLADQRLMIPTQVVPPGEPARAMASRNRARSLLLDNASRRQFPDPVPYPPPRLSAEHSIRVGDGLDAVTGVLDYRYEQWRLQPLTTPVFHPDNPRPPPPSPAAPEHLRLAAFNVENYFNGAGGFPTARGARSPRELARQEAKLGAVLAGLGASVVALAEVANDGYDSQSSVASLAALAGEHWQWARPAGEGPKPSGGDEIAVGLIYDDRVLAAEGAAMSPEHPAFARHNRPPLAQWLRHRASGGRLLVVVNHWKSKRCQGAQGENRDQQDGQACWNPRREAAAGALLKWLGSLPVEDDTPVLLLGDFNAYARETPLRRLAREGFGNLMGKDSAKAYSYVFRGQSGALTHALGNSAVQRRLAAIGHWAVNADEPAVLGYRLQDKPPSQRETLFSEGPWRSSDHDPLWLDLQLGDGG
ncbi:MAG: ExeM/NucH family extracellular endonuclease [Oleiphilaceae bacterium]|nr:ExeM/NucH family extracellular endonuclease [Oleiphilaceae bacterium]